MATFASLQDARKFFIKDRFASENGRTLEALTEEIADVELCISLLMGGDYVDFDAVMELIDVRDKRWHERLREAHHEEQ